MAITIVYLLFCILNAIDFSYAALQWTIIYLPFLKFEFPHD